MSPIFLFLYNIKKLKNSNFCVPINKNVPLNIPNVKTCAESSLFSDLAHVFTFWLEKWLGWFKRARREDYDSLCKYSSYYLFLSEHFSYLGQIGCLFQENYPSQIEFTDTQIKIWSFCNVHLCIHQQQQFLDQKNMQKMVAKVKNLCFTFASVFCVFVHLCAS